MSLPAQETIECPACGQESTFTRKQCDHQAPVQYSFLYHDMEHCRMIWLIAPGDELIEKVLIWDSGFDDRVMELYKLNLREQLVAEEQLVGPVFYSSAPDNHDVAGVLELVMLTEDGPTPISVPAQTYHEFEEQTADLFAGGEHDPVEWLRVDQEYARALMDG